MESGLAMTPTLLAGVAGLVLLAIRASPCKVPWTAYLLIVAADNDSPELALRPAMKFVKEYLANATGDSKSSVS